jgi:hypothetical protein
MSHTTRIESFNHPYDALNIIADYADGGSRFSNRIIEVLEKYQVSIHIPLKDIRAIEPERTVVLSEESLKKLEVNKEGINETDKSALYQDSYLEIIQLSSTTDCLVKRHLKGKLDEELAAITQRRCKSLSFFEQFPHLTPRLFEYLREGDISLEVINPATDCIIGSGAIGTIYKIALSSGKEYALKVFTLNTQGHKDVYSFNKCLGLMQMLKDIPSHKNVAQFEKLVFNAKTGEFGLCFEMIQGSTFKNWIGMGQTKKDVLKVVIDLMEGLKYLEEAGYCRPDHDKGNNFMVEDSTLRGVVIDYEILRSQAISSPIQSLFSRKEFCDLVIPYLPPDLKPIFAMVQPFGPDKSESPEWDELISSTKNYLAVVLKAESLIKPISRWS